MSNENLATLIDEALTEASSQPPSAVLRVNRPVRMTNRQKDIVRALACVMWADGHASPEERRIIEQVIDELGPNTDERIELSACLDSDCTRLDEVQLENLEPDEKQVLLTHAVVLTMADDVQLPSEKEMITKMIARLALPEDIVRTIMEDAREDGAVSLPGSALAEEA